MANLNDTLRHNMMGQFTTAITATSRLNFYTGTKPAKTAAPTGTLLVSLTPASTAGTDSAGTYTFAPIASATAGASGTPGYWRLIDGTTDDGTHTQFTGTAGVGSGEFNFGSTISSGGLVSISSFTVTEGNG